MHLDHYINRNENIKAENRLLKFAIVVIGLACVVSAFVSYSAAENAKVVILPPVVDKRIVISGNTVNDNYLKLFTKYTLNLMLNYTPETYHDQMEDLLKLATPEFFPALNHQIEDMADSVKNLVMTSLYYPYTMKINKDKQTITVQGLGIQTAHGQVVDNQKRQYLLRYRIINGRFYLNGISELKTR
jgi:conjugal transfer pilus assembly protein TraE